MMDLWREVGGVSARLYTFALLMSGCRHLPNAAGATCARSDDPRSSCEVNHARKRRVKDGERSSLDDPL